MRRIEKVERFINCNCESLMRARGVARTRLGNLPSRPGVPGPGVATPRRPGARMGAARRPAQWAGALPRLASHYTTGRQTAAFEFCA